MRQREQHRWGHERERGRRERRQGVGARGAAEAGRSNGEGRCEGVCEGGGCERSRQRRVSDVMMSWGGKREGGRRRGGGDRGADRIGMHGQEGEGTCIGRRVWGAGGQGREEASDVEKGGLDASRLAGKAWGRRMHLPLVDEEVEPRVLLQRPRELSLGGKRRYYRPHLAALCLTLPLWPSSAAPTCRTAPSRPSQGPHGPPRAAFDPRRPLSRLDLFLEEVAPGHPVGPKPSCRPRSAER